MLNWGTFDTQVWRFSPATDTALLTGDIGSGKSTIVDALTTLLVPSHKAAYNKAAGAEARERTLRSYVEGHYKSERNEATGKSRAKGLRENRGTYSVILGVFTNHGYDETVTLAQVFQQRESTGQPHRFFVVATKQLSIATDFADFGSDLRDLRKRLRAAGAEIFDEFPKYATSLRRLLGIRSEQALELFHQTVSLKSVGNLNDFVRDHMLEPSDSTERVRDIIAHFDDLTKAHDAVKRAREQLEALEPVVATTAKYDDALTQRDARERSDPQSGSSSQSFGQICWPAKLPSWNRGRGPVAGAGQRQSPASDAHVRTRIPHRRARKSGWRSHRRAGTPRPRGARSGRKTPSCKDFVRRRRLCRWTGSGRRQRGVRSPIRSGIRRASAAGGRETRP
ncbi:P-loop containing region of AAA domain protein [Mycobacterium kansasii 732]|nr:P-loop containing region of AAA domain protein [Mycobacterium kansasii 732]